jgi:hypothetical protein
MSPVSMSGVRTKLRSGTRIVSLAISAVYEILSNQNAWKVVSSQLTVDVRLCAEFAIVRAKTRLHEIVYMRNSVKYRRLTTLLNAVNTQRGHSSLQHDLVFS